ncbi:MAG: hypothetical protein Q7R49_07315 [Candidatus Daviesbacteria bacterium]|nr:hypothetical protein [Candidatus Daviesbacteria bacterium]
MELLTTNLYIFLLATVLAILEIQIEGEAGWAKNLPTWRPHPGNLIGKIYKKAMSGKELTGYHASMFILVFLIFQMPYFFGVSFTLEHWLQTLSLYFIFIALWDFLWFVLNPYYPLKDFIKNNPNHKSFFLGMPVDYYFAIVVSLVILIPIAFASHSVEIIDWWSINIVLFVIETIITILFSIFILNIDNWQKK